MGRLLYILEDDWFSLIKELLRWHEGVSVCVMVADLNCIQVRKEETAKSHFLWR